jgi:hypothetical protein
MRQRYTAGQGQLWTEVADHPDDMVFLSPEVEGAVAPFGISGGLALPLREKAS